MKNRYWLFFFILLVVMTFSLVIACDEESDDEDEDDDDGSDGCTVKYVCQYIWDNNCSDDESISECQSKWTASCTNIPDYLPCACDCLESATGCEILQTGGCEHDCWNNFCL